MNTEESLTPDEKWDNATLANNFIFYKVMRNHPEACKHLIELLLKIRVNSMEIHGEEVIEDAKTLLSDGKYSAQEISELLNIPVEMFQIKKS